MRTKIATIVVLVALLGAAALVGATMAGADQVSGASSLGVLTTPQGTVPAIPAAPACANGVDDDGDGLIDSLDPDCESPEDTTEQTTESAPPAGGEATTPSAPPTPANPAAPAAPAAPAGGEEGGAGKEGEQPGSNDGGLKQGETIGGGHQAERRGGVTHNDDLGDSSGGGSGGGAGAVKAPSATGGGDHPLNDKDNADGGSQFEAGGAPTLANPTTTIAPFGPAPIGVPNFVIDSFEIPPFLLPIY